jgi:quercetin dioxygenase-like cupin family protein
MSHRVRAMMSVAILTLAGPFRAAGQAVDKGVVKPLDEVTFPDAAAGQCIQRAAETGDPRTGPSTVIMRAPTGCAAPWHYHTAEEQVMVVEGTLEMEMEGMAPHLVGPGGFAMMPSKAKHRFACKSAGRCTFFVAFDRIYDIFRVDKTP